MTSKKQRAPAGGAEARSDPFCVVWATTRAKHSTTGVDLPQHLVILNAAPTGDDPRLRWLVQQLHNLGQRALWEFIRELDDPDGRVRARLEEYANIDPEKLRITGGDKMPPAPIHLVDGDRDD